MPKQDLEWKMYDNIFIIALFIGLLASIIIEDWMLAILCLALFGIILMIFWKDIYVFIASTYLNRNNIEKAKSLCDKVLNKNPENILALNKKAEIYKRQKDYDESLKLLKKSIKSNPNYYPTWLLQSEVYKAKSDLDNAKKSKETADKIRLEFESKKLHNRILSKLMGF